MTAVKRAVVRLARDGTGTVELDGQTIPGIRAVSVHTEGGCRPSITLEILAHEVDLQQRGLYAVPKEAAADAPAHD